MDLNHNYINIKRLLIVFVALVPELAFSQTFLANNNVTGSSGLGPGEYYHNTDITLTDITLTPGAGESYSFYISGNVPLALTPSTDQNFIITYVPKTNGITSTAQFAGRSTNELMASIKYLDGLGRPLQNIQVKGSPNQYDLVQPIAYDPYGRESVKYQPYSAGGGNAGSYRSAALSQQAAFYNPSSPGAPGMATTSFPYAVTQFELSPLNRVLQQGAPGDNWQLAGTSGASSPGHTVKRAYGSNDVSNTVKQYNVVVNANNNRTLIDQGTYPVSSLVSTITMDENWISGKAGTTEEYKDKEGNVVLKRNFNLVGGTLQTLSTYYVYDSYGNLCFVLSPGSNPDNGLNSASNQTVLDNFAYQYRYDGNNRLIQKKVPGKGWEFMVYNKLDQVIFTQDAVQRNKSPQVWTYIKYDALGRPAITGLWSSGNITGSAADASISSPSQVLRLWLVDWAELYQTTLWVTRNNSGPHGYNTIDPLGPVLTVNYYDDYGFPDIPFSTPTATGIASNVTGLPTATKVAVLNTIYNATPDMLWTVNYYDEDGRARQVYKQHYLGGSLNTNNYDLITNTYDFNNQIVASERKHYQSNSSTPKITVADNYTYDHVGRKKQTTEVLNGTTTTVISNNDYNEIGQLLTKHLHGTGSGFLQNVDYSYNERGWLRTSTSSSNIYNLNLKYNTASNPQYNGNIGQMDYTVNNPSSTTRQFIYTYDALNRLTNATSSGNTLDEALAYDLTGNITSLTRSGQSYGALSYTYTGNQLTTVTGSGFATRNYGYDNNGNATSDGGSKIITYNILNLPQSVNFDGSSIATYFYDAAGNKLRTTSNADGTRDYISGINYYNGAISSITTGEGRIKAEANLYTYQYDLKDHLGNTRVTFDKHPSTGVVRILQEDEYYSFGLRRLLYDNSNDNRYLYNGKDVQVDLANQYDYGARFYDPVIGRWTSVDPLAEKHVNLSPMTYVFNNPIKTIDPDGRDGIVSIKGNTITISTSIYVYGKNATTATANQIQNDIMNAWAKRSDGKNWEYTDPETNKVYSVKFDVSVQLYGGKERQNPLVIGDEFNPFSRNNYIELDGDTERSHVTKGDIGLWDPNDTWAMGHEWGHLVGLGDKYSDVGDHSEAWDGWRGNIMGEYGGAVEQKNINSIIGGSMNGFNRAKKAAETFNNLREQGIKKGYGQIVGAKHLVPGEDYEYETSINTINPNN